MAQFETIKSKIDQLPDQTGVYILKRGNSTIYIGKATNIRKRVQSHFLASKSNQRERMIINQANKIDYIVTKNETDALIEENILIKTYKPKFNVRLSDDKTYPYIKIDLNSLYPCLEITRRIKNDNAKYFGPYSDVGAMRNTIKIIRKIFPIRTCKNDLKKFKKRACLYYHIDQCCAPCLKKITKMEYNAMVNKLILFLEGKRNEVKQKIMSEMNAASIKQNYERAAILRDQFHDIEKTIQKVRVALPSNEDLDAIAIVKVEEKFCAQVIQVREGKIVSSESFDLKGAEDVAYQEVLESFLKQYYLKRAYIPEKLIVNKRISDSMIISRWLSEKCGKNVYIKKPLDKKLIGVLEIAEENAKTHLNQTILQRKKTVFSLRKLKSDLGLKKLPKLIECFDISTLGEKYPVGSKVAFLDGIPYKKGYRMYKIRTVLHQDDQAMIGEIVSRRFKRMLKENEKPPNLVVVDGGLAQLRAAKLRLDEFKIDIPIIGLAKRLEQIYLPDGKILHLDRNSKSSLLLQHIRDEAHRFAIKYHRKRRERFKT